MCEALRGRVRLPMVDQEFPLVLGADLGDVEDAKTELLHQLEVTLGVRKLPAPVGDKASPRLGLCCDACACGVPTGGDSGGWSSRPVGTRGAW